MFDFARADLADPVDMEAVAGQAVRVAHPEDSEVENSVYSNSAEVDIVAVAAVAAEAVLEHLAAGVVEIAVGAG